MSAVYQCPGMYPDEGPHLSLCMECGHVHAPERRRQIIRRMLPATTADMADAYPCLLGVAETSTRVLREMGAVRDADGVWSLP